jgi:translation initiation factor IF-2
MIVAFAVNISRAVEGTAAASEVPLYSSTIIYRVMDEVRDRVTALLPPKVEKKVTGEANVLQLFDIHLKGRRTKQVAGCRVVNGLVEKSKSARVVRDGTTVHEGLYTSSCVLALWRSCCFYSGPLGTLKHGKKDMTEIRKGMECGISFADFEDLRPDDLIQMYQEIEKPGVL